MSTHVTAHGGKYACTKCGTSTAVIETRTFDAGIRRRRQCLNVKCKFRFTTYESSVIPLAQEEIARRLRSMADGLLKEGATE
jgi:transcriptional regulator NrdR family protein